MGSISYEVFRRAQHIPKELLVFRPHTLLFAFCVISWGWSVQDTIVVHRWKSEDTLEEELAPWDLGIKLRLVGLQSKCSC